ncbi:hypothetical protein GIB67_025164 [Kingdonia uniflora]|uniref:Uncharacterized protein n=1 Tax=Kingdonia uniflora TaxID=39325 RepID=A0A7J7N8F1_9MAGN|nr:hypothetical protein GIB67_025164 [Kingdonia uniflora]
MAFSWKVFKYKIKLQHYKKYNTYEERLGSIPPRVEPNQWPTLAMAQKNSDNRANITCHPRTGRKTFARVKTKRMEDNEPIDDLSIYRATRCIGNDLYNTEDGSAERKETIRQRLLQLPEEERETNIEARDNIFKDDELAKLQREADEREAQHQQEIKNVKASMNNVIQVEVRRLMQIAGIPFPDNN